MTTWATNTSPRATPLSGRRHPLRRTTNGRGSSSIWEISTSPPVSPAQEAREDWEDESYEPDSGYPENDAFVDEQTGEETDAYRDGDDLRADVTEVLDSTEVYDDTGIRLRWIVGTVVVLGGAAASREDLDAVVAEILDLEGVADVDVTDVDVR